MLFDRQVARLDPPLRAIAQEFLLVRLTRMRGIDLDLFDFDYDLTWMGFFLGSDGRVLGRYGGRDAEGPEGKVSLAGLKYAMERALARHRDGSLPPPAPKRSVPRTVDDFAATRRLPDRACVHCHQVYDLRRETLQAEGKWRQEELWVYPLPENIGLSVSVDQGDLVTGVGRGSPADRAGLRKGDRLVEAGKEHIASFADLQYALHRAPASGRLPVRWERNAKPHSGELLLTDGWRKTDLSWRWSLRGVDPQPWVQGGDLTRTERKALGLTERQLALEQGPFVSQPARQAGVRQGDVVLGVDGKMLEMSARQFGAYIRLNYKVGDRVTYHLLRDGKRLDVTLTLRGRR
jgi:hypothetical protein